MTQREIQARLKIGELYNVVKVFNVHLLEGEETFRIWAGPYKPSPFSEPGIDFHKDTLFVYGGYDDENNVHVFWHGKQWFWFNPS